MLQEKRESGSGPIARSSSKFQSSCRHTVQPVSRKRSLSCWFVIYCAIKMVIKERCVKSNFLWGWKDVPMSRVEAAERRSSLLLFSLFRANRDEMGMKFEDGKIEMSSCRQSKRLKWDQAARNSWSSCWRQPRSTGDLQYCAMQSWESGFSCSDIWKVCCHE